MSNVNFDYKAVEGLIGYTFNNKDLLKSAFTHRSYSHENGGYNNERLEFLGDSLLGFVVAEHLFRKKGKSDEGKMTREKQNLVSKIPLSRAIENLGLQKYIIFGESVSSNSNNPSFSENLFEALVASIYLDGGFDQAKDFIYRFLIDAQSNKRGIKSVDESDYKSRLQIFTQSKKMGTPTYTQIAKTGEDHNPLFTIGVVIEGKTIAVGQGGSKSEASKDAAKRALKKLTGRNG